LHSEHEISQFADDTSVILDGSEESLNETLLELEWFKKISGLKINFSKTQVIWIGSKKYSSDRLCENWNLSWGKTTGRISDLTTVILPIGVKFLLFHCLKESFHFFKILFIIDLCNFRNINIEIYSQNSKRSFSPGEIPVFTVEQKKFNSYR
jgi:hypothetical protein